MSKASLQGRDGSTAPSPGGLLGNPRRRQLFGIVRFDSRVVEIVPETFVDEGTADEFTVPLGNARLASHAVSTAADR